MLDWISCVLEDFLKQLILKWIAERLVTRLKWMIQTHLEDRMAEWVPVQKHRRFWRHTPQSVCFYTVKASRVQQGVQTEAMYLVFISFYFRDRDKKIFIFLRVCWLKAKVWKNLSRSLIVWLSSTNYWSCRDPPDCGGRKRTQNLSLSFTDFLPILCVSNLWFSFIWIDMAMTGLMMATVLMMVMMTLLLWSDGINESGSQLLLLHFLFLSHAVSLFFHM